MSGIQVKNICGLSPVQEGMYFHYLMNKANDPYVIQSTYELNGVVDIDRLKSAFELLVQRHDCMRTLFMHQKTPDPVQIILKSRDIPFEFTDLSDSGEVEKTIQDYLKTDRSKGFDLARDPLVRLHLFRCEEQNYRLVMTLHHIILDGWSSGIIERELFMLYAGGRFRAEIENSAPVSFSEYIKWLKTQPNEQGIEFFKQKLGSNIQFAPFTRGRKREQGVGEEVHALIESISGKDTQRLKALASDLRVTTADLLRSIWSFTVARFTAQDSFTSLHTVSGRPSEMHRSSEMVGMFINAMVQPYTNEDRGVRDVVRHQHELFAESMSWQHLALSQIAKSLSVNGELSDNLVVLENYPDMGDEREELEREIGFSFAPVKSEESTNYPVTVQFHVDSTVEVRFFMKKAWFREADIQNLNAVFYTVLDEVLRDVFQSVKSITRADSNTSTSKLARDPVSVFITSNFTDTNITPYLKWWLDQAGFDASITLADYNTIHQQVTDGSSTFYSQSGPKVILIKLSDLARFMGDLDTQNLESFLRDSLGIIAESIAKSTNDGPTIIGLTPDNTERSGFSDHVLKQIGDQFIDSASKNTSLKILDLRDAPLRPSDLFDEVTDHMGHVPYSEAGYSYIASQIARIVRVWKHQPFKVIALDADNTLWKGVLGEDGVNGVEITSSHRYLQEFVRSKKDEGFILVMCTKNNASDIEEFFRLRDDMVLKQDDFVSIAANWGAKSSNLKAIADDLNLGIDSFIFLDDSSLEIREVNESQPDVLALQLPENLANWKTFLDRNWAFDTFTVTQEDKQRTAMYLADKKRKEIAESNENNSDFVAQLDVKTKFFPLGDHNLDRIEQLTQRTNQFNLNGLRFSKSEVLEYASRPEHLVYSLSVSDRFGDYGITGALFARVADKEIVVDAWMLSCRVLARGVEHHVLRYLGDVASENNADSIRFQHKVTPKNVPIQLFLSDEGFSRDPDSKSELISFRIHVEQLKKLPQTGSFEVLSSYENEALNINVVKEKPQRVRNQASSGTKTSDHSLDYWVYESSASVENHPRNSRYLHELHRVRPDLLEESRFHDTTETATAVAYEEPITPTEIRMAAIWSSLLESDRIGRRHDFFLSGGNSLMATRLASRIYREFEVEIELGSIFEHPVLCDFCTIIDQSFKGKSSTLGPIERVELAHYPLSPAQHRIWRSEQLFESQAGYVLGGMYVISGQFDLEKLHLALILLGKTHDSLRTSFPVVDGEPRQVIHDEVHFDVRNLEEFGELSDPEALNNAFFSRKMDLENGPLLEVGYAKITQNEHLLAIKIHHLITDGWSQGILMGDLMKFYESSEDKETRKSSRFVDFVRWSALRELNASESVKSFWKSELTGDLERVTLPYDFTRPTVIKQSPIQFRVPIDQRFKDSVNAFSRKHQLSLYMTMMASVQLLVQKYTGKTDVIIGSPFSGRVHPDVHQTVGFFVNTLPFRMNSSPEMNLKAWLNEIRSKTIKLLELQHVPIDSLLTELNIEHDQRPPLFDVLLLVQELASGEGSTTDFNVESIGSEHLGAGYDVVFQVFDSPNGWELVLEYQPELYHERSIRMIAEHWKAMLSNMTKASVDKPISSIEVHDESLRDKIIQLGAGAKKDYRRQTLVQVFKEAVELYPNNAALIDESKVSISYRDLDRRTDILAQNLLELGVGAGDRVVVNLERKSTVIECMLAIMKCRAVYVPVDSETPMARTEYILDTCQPKLWIRDSEEFTSESPSRVASIVIDDLKSITPSNDTLDLPSEADPDEMAYIIFTSGSTGRPKGVAVHHQGLVNMTHSHIQNTATNSDDRVLCFASISFDASISEFFMGIMAGASMVCPPLAVRKDAMEFVDYMNELKITVVTLPPVFLANLNQPNLPHLKSIVTAGEAARKADALYFAKTKRYINAYGPTECSVGTNAHIVNPDATYHSGVPIGRAYDNIQLAVLDESLNLAPFGAQGQLAVSGIQVAIGYFGNPELTSKSFINHPLFPGKTYLTGDQVRWNYSGELEFIGRNDTQVKIRGYRIELDEIKHQIDTIDSIKVSFLRVLVDSSGEKQIVAYLVEKKPISDSDVRAILSESLPNYMIPGYFERVEEIKLTINGKVDLKALPNPFERPIASTNSAIPASDNPIQKVFYETLSRFLPTFDFNLDRTFLQAGGDSIKAIQIAHQFQQQGFAIRPGQFYELTSLGQLLDLVVSNENSAGSRPEIVTGIVACNPMQIKFFNEVLNENQRDLFLMQAGFKLGKKISVDSIKSIFAEIADYHEIFRMRFIQHSIDPKVEITDTPEYQFVELNSESNTFKNDLKEYYDKLESYINIQSGRLASFLVVCSPHETQVVATFHHLIIDATSLRVLRDQLQWLTAQLEAGKELKLTGNYLSQQEWTTYIQNLSIQDDETTHWKKLHLETGINIDKKVTEVSSVQIDKSTTRNLLRVCSTKGISIDSLILGVVHKSLTAHLNLSSLRIGIESQGRKAGDKTTDIGSTLGWFTLEYPIKLTASDTINSILNEISEQTNSVRLDGLTALITRNRLQKDNQTVYPPDVGFNYLGEFESGHTASDEWNWDSTYLSQGQHFDHKWHPIELSALIEQGELKIQLQSNTSKLDKKTIDQVLVSLENDFKLWIDSISDSVTSKPVLICFPFVASNASFFDLLKQELSDHIELITLELPGHGARIDEPLLTTLDAACEDLIRQLRKLNHQPGSHIWLGHSMGAYLAVSLASLLENDPNLKPSGILFSDVAAPGQFEKWIVGEMSTDQKSEYYRRLGYDKIIESLDSVSKAHFEAIIAADLSIVRPFVHENHPPVDVPARFLYSTQNSLDTVNEWISGWKKLSHHEIQIQPFEGGHIDWLQESSNAQLLQTLIDSIFQEVKHEI